jgi:hypothetical protein
LLAHRQNVASLRLRPFAPRASAPLASDEPHLAEQVVASISCLGYSVRRSLLSPLGKVLPYAEARRNTSGRILKKLMDPCYIAQTFFVRFPSLSRNANIRRRRSVQVFARSWTPAGVGKRGLAQTKGFSVYAAGITRGETDQTLIQSSKTVDTTEFMKSSKTSRSSNPATSAFTG